MGLPLKLPKGIRARPWVRRQLGTGRKSGCGASWRQKFDGNSKGPGSRFTKVGERIHQVNFRSERSEDSVRRRVLSFGMSVWITFFGSALGSYLLGFPVAAFLLRCGVIDRPNARSSHARPTIRGGGIAILAALGLAGIKLVLDQGGGVSTVLLLGALVLAVVSFLDDLRSVPPLLRFGCHAAVAVAVLVALLGPSASFGAGWGYPWGLSQWLGLVVLFLWLTGYTNAFNFMDGINGIAAGQAVITGIGMALLAGTETGRWDSAPVLFSLALAGAAAGFLPHNFPRARMFMGDVGSAPLGFLLAALVCWLGLADHGRLLIPLALLHANFVLDTGITLVRRVWRGECWYAAHREHFYQRLVASGKSHGFVTGWEMLLQLSVLALVYVYLRVDGVAKVALGFGVVSLCGVFFLFSERAFRATERARARSAAQGAGTSVCV